MIQLQNHQPQFVWCIEIDDETFVFMNLSHPFISDLECYVIFGAMTEFDLRMVHLHFHDEIHTKYTEYCASSYL